MTQDPHDSVGWEDKISSLEPSFKTHLIFETIKQINKAKVFSPEEIRKNNMFVLEKIAAKLDEDERKYDADKRLHEQRMDEAREMWRREEEEFSNARKRM